ncbi:endospore germination permease [uncultured Paenibacillus sp.]|uniref:GerAB/ArcD/ProY family transporter n=1 Tax=uncultured Paenibacillus sp. TaxID=227322 RepID=UPI0015B0A4F0|nr:endospore germination permease [uncultured Paenibacillus sp.]
MNQTKISLRQLTILTALFTVGSAILIVPSGMAAAAKQDAWIAALLALGTGLPLVWLMAALVRRYPGMTLVGILEALLGKWIGKTVAFILAMTLFLAGPATVLHDVGDFMATQMMPETPIEAIIILFAAVVLMGIRLGVEVVARSAEMLFPWFILLYVSLVFLISFQIEPRHAAPLLEFGFAPLWPAALSFIGVVFLPHIALLLFLPPSANRPAEFGRGLFLGSLFGGCLLAIIIALSILVLGPEITARSLYPSYSLAKKIDIAHFLQRIEVLVAVIWFISLYFRITLYTSAVTYSLTQIFGLKDHRPLVLPLGMLLVATSIVIYPNIPFKQTWDTETWTPYILTAGLALPLVLGGVHLLRNMISNKKRPTPPSART